MKIMPFPLFIAAGDNASDLSSEIAGSKAMQLWRIAQLGLPVPPAFVLPTSLCDAICQNDKKALEDLRTGLERGIVWLEQKTGLRFGDSRAPLLVSVRSGAAISMPGMLETVLDIGLNDETVHGLIRMSGNPRQAFDSLRRLLQGYAEVVYGVASTEFERCLANMIQSEGAASEADLDSEALERLAFQFRDLIVRLAGQPVPSDPVEQLTAAACAVYRSWQSAKAVEYRSLNSLDHLQGTAVTVQAMVFGNSGSKSGAGVAFSRNPATGEDELYIDFLFNAQGEDVVAGRRTPSHAERLSERLPAAAAKLAEGIKKIEAEARDVQDIEFTIDRGCLYFLQTRTAKRTPRAALRIAVDLVHEGIIDEKTALSRVAGLDRESVSITHFDEALPAEATAISAAPGVITGRAVFNCDRAKECAAAGDPVVLVRPDTSTEDIKGFAVADGILTASGGRTSHAAVVARQMGKVCLVGCQTLSIDEARGEARIGSKLLKDGDWISLDGDRGEITLGKRAIIHEVPSELHEMERWETGDKPLYGSSTESQ